MFYWCVTLSPRDDARELSVPALSTFTLTFFQSSQERFFVFEKRVKRLVFHPFVHMLNINSILVVL